MKSYKIYPDKTAIYFSTCTIVRWLVVFKEEEYFQIIIDSLDYCIKNKGLFIIGYVIMLNHIHLITWNKLDTTLAEIMRDFKHFTATEISRTLEKNNERLLLWIMKKEAMGKNKKQAFKVWQDDYHPIAIHSDKWLLEKLQYIHNNPVRKGFVNLPEEWKYSSARNWILDQNHLIQIDKEIIGW